MKKLILVGAIVCATCIANAAAVSWTLDGINAPGTDGSGWGSSLAGGAGYTVELIVGTGVTDGAITGVITDWVHELGELEGGYMENYSESATMANDTAYYAQVVITYGDSTLTSAIGTIEAATINDGVAEPYFSTDPSLVANFEGFTPTANGAFTTTGWSSSAVPEPTSGLLMLLGMAGLALKRKRA